MRSVAHYRATGLAPLLSVAGDGRLEAALARIMVGWGLDDAGADRGGDGPRLQVEQSAKGWRCTGDGFEEPVTYADPVAAGCGVVAGLFKAHTFADPDGLCLHAAGIRFGDGIALLTGDYRSGKSVLTAACCAAGQQVFSDDIVPFVPGRAVARAPGLALRLRLPLPDGLDAATRRFLDAHRVLESRRYLYVRPPQMLLAGNGAEAPIRAVVAIRRSAGAPARMTRIAPGDALAELIRRNFARELPARRILDSLDRLVAAVPCLCLRYGDAGEAAALMRRVLAGREAALEGLPLEDALRAQAPEVREAAPAVAPDAPVFRAPGVSLHERDPQCFLTDAEERTIFHLNATGAALWRLLEAPAAFAEIVATFAAAFPDRPRDRLAADLGRLVDELAREGLVRIGTARGSGGRRDDGLRAGCQ